MPTLASALPLEIGLLHYSSFLSNPARHELAACSQKKFFDEFANNLKSRFQPLQSSDARAGLVL